MRRSRVLTTLAAAAATTVLLTTASTGTALASPRPGPSDGRTTAAAEVPTRAGMPGVPHRHVRHWLSTLADLVDDEVISADQARAIVVATRAEVRTAIDAGRDQVLDGLVADGVLTAGQAELLGRTHSRREMRHVIRDLVRSGRLDAESVPAIRAAFRDAVPEERPPLRDFLLAALDDLVADATITDEQAEAVAAAFPGRPLSEG